MPVLRGLGRRAARGGDWVELPTRRVERVGGSQIHWVDLKVGGSQIHWVDVDRVDINRVELEREDSLPPFSTHPGPSDGGVSAWGYPLLAHRGGAPTTARTGGQCSTQGRPGLVRSSGRYVTCSPSGPS